MFIITNENTNKTERYQTMLQQLEAILINDSYSITNLANMASLLHHTLEDINWVGFYLLDDGVLKLGPFMGLPACTSIQLDRGVCGHCYSEQKTIVVDDVHSFPGHIACDAASLSEIVVPIFKDSKCIALLDIDAPILNRFDSIDQEYLEKAIILLEKYL